MRRRHKIGVIVSAVAVAAAGTFAATRGGSSSGPPAAALNSQVTQANIGSTICVSGWTATVRPPASYTSSLKAQQIAARRLADTSPASYEEDHAVPLEVGGNPTSPTNLWPEPIAQARSDDRVENQTKADVCSGKITLDQGRRSIWTLKKAHGL